MINSVVLVGRLTRDAELRKTTTGTSVTSFTIAVDDSRKGVNGEKQTIFMNVTAFMQTADNVVKFTRKGSLVGVVGRLTQRKYVNRANVEITTTEVVATQVEFLTPKGDKTTDATGFVPDVNSAEDIQPEEISDDSDVTNDDLPF